MNKQQKKQRNRCYICLEEVLVTYMGGCQYQFSVDRIFNDLPHNKSNCLIACLYCNCSKYNRRSKGEDCEKLCKRNCHILPRNLPHKKDIIRMYEPEVNTRLIW